MVPNNLNGWKHTIKGCNRRRLLLNKFSKTIPDKIRIKRAANLLERFAKRKRVGIARTKALSDAKKFNKLIG